MVSVYRFKKDTVFMNTGRESYWVMLYLVLYRNDFQNTQHYI